MTRGATKNLIRIHELASEEQALLRNTATGGASQEKALRVAGDGYPYPCTSYYPLGGLDCARRHE